MTALKLLLAATAGLITAGVLLKPCCQSRAEPQRPLAPSYVQRGDRVQEHYRMHTERVQGHYESLHAALKVDAPDLLPLLETPKRLPQGYQVLPHIMPRAPASQESPRAGSAWYSWPWTDQLIDKELKKIARFEAELHGASALSSRAKRSVYEKLARSYSLMRAGQKNVHAHIRYNRLWQAAIASDRAGYDVETILHDAVLERQSLLDAMNGRSNWVFNQTGLKQIDARQTKNVLVEREKFLARSIRDATAQLRTPSFVRIEDRGRHSCIVHVPFYTDINDHDFVQSVKDTIENIWRVRDGAVEFAVDLEISLIPVNELYGDRPPPLPGDRIDAARHLALFPPDRAVLTTGGITTHVYTRGIILGPDDVAAAVLAHEFGHILGFRDSYFRGYRDLGVDGFQVMEVISDPTDIMGAPSGGVVRRRHFESILERAHHVQCSGESDRYDRDAVIR